MRTGAELQEIIDSTCNVSAWILDYQRGVVKIHTEYSSDGIVHRGEILIPIYEAKKLGERLIELSKEETIKVG